MAQEQARGSSKMWQRLFESDAPSPEEMTRALSSARSSYKVLRWWKYGQPAIDVIRARLDVPEMKNAGEVIQDLLQMHGNEIQVALDVFPYGIINPDGVHINVVLERQMHR